MCAALGLVGYATSAAFTDAGSVGASFVSGKLDLSVSDGTTPGQGAPTPYPFNALTVDGMYPGGPASYAELRLVNSGTLPLTVTTIGSSAATAGSSTTAQADALGTAVRLRFVTLGPSDVCNANFMDVVNGSGTGSPIPTTVNVSAQQGATLGAGANWRLCFKLAIPADTVPPAAAQGASMRVMLAVDARQVQP
ncbi:putative ribosomally synthesized peptide with SipW-like signal peptide [Antricoccus suffuscus]|uniref:Putative ribosomally synthesized peptide with SipW-like signal peptide n=2 Tax=Antricoccus suffuscus TaxID=1629062 RepID=A0A2T1A1I5_9ACTN|nr:putative ribosomally synthesized peptide with SipW-like signal peptide [Antricoccus suffuscus]